MKIQNRDFKYMAEEKSLWSKILKPVAIGAVITTAVVGANSAIDGYFDVKDSLAITSNLCYWEEAVATEDSSYRNWSVKAIKESDDLGKKVGVDRLGERLSERNNGRDVVPGEKYRILNCYI